MCGRTSQAVVEFAQERVDALIVGETLRERAIRLDADGSVNQLDLRCDAIERAKIDGCVLSFCVLVHRVVDMGYSSSIVRNGGTSPAAARASR